MTENEKICLENIEKIGFEANDRARALIVAFAQGFVQGVKAAKEESTAKKADDKTDSTDED